jgi:DNA-binding PadR family transcriptional regulator
MKGMLGHYKSMSVYLKMPPKEFGLMKGEYVVFSLVCGLIQRNKGIISQLEVCKSNSDIITGTTYNIIHRLVKKGYLSKHRPSNQFYSRSYLSLTDKGLLLQAKILEALK